MIHNYICVMNEKMRRPGTHYNHIMLHKGECTSTLTMALFRSHTKRTVSFTLISVHLFSVASDRIAFNYTICYATRDLRERSRWLFVHNRLYSIHYIPVSISRPTFIELVSF